jgi:hypothetical protein
VSGDQATEGEPDPKGNDVHSQFHRSRRGAPAGARYTKASAPWQSVVVQFLRSAFPIGGGLLFVARAGLQVASGEKFD